MVNYASAAEYSYQELLLRTSLEGVWASELMTRNPETLVNVGLTYFN